ADAAGDRAPDGRGVDAGPERHVEPIDGAVPPPALVGGTREDDAAARRDVIDDDAGNGRGEGTCRRRDAQRGPHPDAELASEVPRDESGGPGAHGGERGRRIARGEREVAGALLREGAVVERVDADAAAVVLL